jgi:hypothetical protein
MVKNAEKLQKEMFYEDKLINIQAGSIFNQFPGLLC